MAKRDISNLVSVAQINEIKDIYVFDTNILIHSPNSIGEFNGMVVIPSVAILELDRNKNGFSFKSVNCRLVSKKIDDGIKNENEGKFFKTTNSLVYVSETSKPTEELFGYYSDDMLNDYSFIQTTFDIIQEIEERNLDINVKLVSMDRNVRIIASTVNVPNQGYDKDSVDNDSLYETAFKVNFEDLNEEIANGLYTGTLKVDRFKNQFESFIGYFNQPLIIGDEVFMVKGEYIKHIPYPKTAMGIKPLNIHQQILASMIQDPEISVIFCNSLAGSGKSIISTAYGLDLVEKGKYEQLMVFKPVAFAGSSDLGFLPGNYSEKKQFLFNSLYDSLEVIYSVNKKDNFEKDGKKVSNDGTKICEMLEEFGVLRTETMTYVLGRSFRNKIIYLDESQCLTIPEIKQLITRCAEDRVTGSQTKIIITGDIAQASVGNRFLNETNNGLSIAIDKLKGQDFVGYINMPKSVRSRICEVVSELL
jgi:PhoH-like ATPase